MARLSDLPPEVRLEIYRLLLIDPVRDGLRITFALDPSDSNKSTWDRARCDQAEAPHKEGHSAHPCHVDVLPSTLHHLDFTDLMSLARTNKTFYVEASQTIYNSTDLTLSFPQLPPAARAVPAFTPLSRYLEHHCPTALTMLHSLVIKDETAAMSPKDMRFLVDLVATQLPNLRGFGYHVGVCTSSSFPELMRSCRNLCRTFRVVQPLARLKADVRKSISSPAPTELASLSTQMNSAWCKMGGRLEQYTTDGIEKVVRTRRTMRKHHALALEGDDYLYCTVVVRSMWNGDMRGVKSSSGIEKRLKSMHTGGSIVEEHRHMLQQAYALEQMIK
jgi:hypothetical protein